MVSQDLGRENVMRITWQMTSVAVFLAVGLWCLFGAKGMQRRAIQASEDLKTNPFRAYIRSSRYLTFTRLIGISAILVAFFLTVVIILQR